LNLMYDEALSNFAFKFQLAPLCHGGPIATPADAAYVLAHTGGLVHGFFGASSMERLPVEAAIADRVREFADLSLPAPGK